MNGSIASNVKPLILTSISGPNEGYDIGSLISLFSFEQDTIDIDMSNRVKIAFVPILFLGNERYFRSIITELYIITFYCSITYLLLFMMVVIPVN